MINTNSGTWRTIEAQARERIEELRNELERSDSPTARGEIKALRWVLEMGAQTPVIADAIPVGYN